MNKLDEYSQFAEDLVFLIRQSCYVQLARVDAYLNGVTLAAEQVQDKRIQLLETPPEVSGWEFFGNILLTFTLESTLGGKLLAAVTKRIFTPILRQNFVFMALPKSPYGVELKRQAQRLARMNAPPPVRVSGGPGRPSVPILRTGRESEAVTISTVLQKGAGGPGLEALGRENVQIYNASLEAIVQGTERAQVNLAAAAKATREAIQRPGPAPALSLGATDSSGVTILAAAQHYASLTRLGVQVRHARFERLVRGQALLPADLAVLADIFEWEDLELDISGQRISCNLSDIRARYKILFEAVIWVRLYGFDATRKTPTLYVNKAEFAGIPKALSDYWRKRFAISIDAWNEATRRFAGRFTDLPEQNQAFFLQAYFWAISKELPQIREGELTQRVTP